jgi:hypothetical protein
MADSTLVLRRPPEEGGVSSPPSAPVLVLDPVGQPPGATPILLDGPRQIIGGGVVGSTQEPDARAQPRQAVILRGRRHFIIKSFDGETWLNGLPVTESLLSDGDLLKVGVLEFRVRPPAACDIPQTALVAKNWRNADRLQHLFHRPRGEMIDGGATGDATLRDPQCAEKAQRPDDHAEITDSVADYMQQLLNRRRSERATKAAEAQAAEKARRAEWARRAAENDLACGAVQLDPGGACQTGPGTPDGSADLTASQMAASARRQRTIVELRAGVGSLRDVANQSARTAVASAISRKLRRLVAFNLALTAIAIVLVVSFVRLGQSDSGYDALAVGATMIGLIHLIHVSQRIWKIRTSDSPHCQPTNGVREETLTPLPGPAGEAPSQSAT